MSEGLTGVISEKDKKVSRRDVLKMMVGGTAGLLLNSAVGEWLERASPEIERPDNALSTYEIGWQARPWVWVNLAIAARHLDGLKIGPGEEVSLIKAIQLDKVGGLNPDNNDPREGYVAAQMSKVNELSGIGYGLCLGSTSLFRAALQSPLRITEQGSHNIRYDDYFNDMPVGTDAAVFFPTEGDTTPRTDLKIFNPTDKQMELRFGVYDEAGKKLDVPNREVPIAEYKASYLDMVVRLLQKKLNKQFGMNVPDQYFPQYMFGNKKITVAAAVVGERVDWNVNMSEPTRVADINGEPNYELRRKLQIGKGNETKTYEEVFRTQYGMQFK